MPNDRVPIGFQEVCRRLKRLTFPPIDHIVGIGTGGAVPASLIAYQLEKPLSVVQINYRAEDNTPQRPQPTVLASHDLPTEPQRILLVDDVSVTGQTLAAARALLSQHTIKTFVLKGQADIVAFPEVNTCVYWAWKTYNEKEASS